MSKYRDSKIKYYNSKSSFYNSQRNYYDYKRNRAIISSERSNFKAASSAIFSGTAFVCLLLILMGLAFPLLSEDMDDFQRGEIVIDQFFGFIGILSYIGDISYKILDSALNLDFSGNDSLERFADSENYGSFGLVDTLAHWGARLIDKIKSLWE